MEHGAVVDRARYVGRVAAARRHHGVERLDAPLGVEAHLVVGDEVVAFPRQAHVVVAIEPDLARLAGEARAECRNRRPLRGLRLLAAERAAHAPGLHRDRGVRQVEHVREQMLQLARMLGRGMDLHVAVLARDRERDLAFEIEMLLAADAQLAFDALGAGGEREAGVVLAERIIRQDAAIGGERVVDGDERRTGRHFEFHEFRRAASLIAGFRHHRECDLTAEFDAVGDEHRIVMLHRADVVRARNVRRRQHRDYARRGAHRGQVHAKQLPGRDRHAADRDVQEPLGLAHVVDEGCASGDVLGR